MDLADIIQHRLNNHRLESPEPFTPSMLVTQMGAFQAQEYNQGKWAFGARIPGSTDYDIEKAIDSKEIIRSWAMRGTLHFLSSKDIRWIIHLLGPKLIRSVASRFKRLELDEPLISKCLQILIRSLEGGVQRSRDELTEIFKQHGIDASGIRLSHILFRANLEGIICHSSKKGSDQSIALLDEWSPGNNDKHTEEALGELAYRYFSSHGPASLNDFRWWSGLSLKDAALALNISSSLLIKLNVDSNIYWSSDRAGTHKQNQLAVLIPGYDEYLLGYEERSLILEKKFSPLVIQPNGIFNPCILIHGKVAGTWRRLIKKDKLIIELKPFKSLKRQEILSIEEKALQLMHFLGIAEMELKI